MVAVGLWWAWWLPGQNLFTRAFIYQFIISSQFSSKFISWAEAPLPTGLKTQRAALRYGLTQRFRSGSIESLVGRQHQPNKGHVCESSDLRLCSTIPGTQLCRWSASGAELWCLVAPSDLFAELTMTKKNFLLFSLIGADPTLDNAAWRHSKCDVAAWYALPQIQFLNSSPPLFQSTEIRKISRHGWDS